MAGHDPDVAPVGEEIHLPGPSLQPLVLTIGITLALVGVTISIVMTVIGVLITIPTLVMWIRSARTEYDELPPTHH